MKAFVLAVGSNKLLCYSDRGGPEGEQVIGAFLPGVEGNYYKELLIGFNEKDQGYTLSFATWWGWLKKEIQRGQTLIDDEFNFEPEEVRVITIEIPLGEKL